MQGNLKENLPKSKTQEFVKQRFITHPKHILRTEHALV